jgi:hypothetical protein
VQCRECRNFNSMFAIVSGLGHSSVSRLKLTWDKLGNKYNRIFKVFISQRQRTGAEAALRCRLLPSPLSSCVRAPQQRQHEQCQCLPMFANIVRKVCRFSRKIRKACTTCANFRTEPSYFANHQCQFSHEISQFLPGNCIKSYRKFPKIVSKFCIFEHLRS